LLRFSIFDGMKVHLSIQNITHRMSVTRMTTINIHKQKQYSGQLSGNSFIATSLGLHSTCETGKCHRISEIGCGFIW